MNGVYWALLDLFGSRLCEEVSGVHLQILCASQSGLRREDWLTASERLTILNYIVSMPGPVGT